MNTNTLCMLKSYRNPPQPVVRCSTRTPTTITRVRTAAIVVVLLLLLLFVVEDGVVAVVAANEETTGTTTTTPTTTTAPPTWEELDARPLPVWYDDAKFGIFIHWGLFSVPSYNSEWFWFNYRTGRDPDILQFLQHTEVNVHSNNYNDRNDNSKSSSQFQYQQYASRFRAELYQPKEWAQAFAQSGAQYIVITSKHHDGYCNWNSKNVTSTWNWNVMDIGPNRDLIGDLAKEIKQTQSVQTNTTMKFGLYHSLYEWYNPMYLYDKANNFTTQQFVTGKTIPELYDLVHQYEPELIWSDGDWEPPGIGSDYWKAREFLHWYTNQSSVAATAVYNDRWGNDVVCQHGSYVTCSDRFNPTKYHNKKYENAFTMDKTSWGYNRNIHSDISKYMTATEIIHTLIQTVAYNGNVLLNIGPNADGTIDPIFLDRLQSVGNWLSVNGEAIYSTRPWMVCQNETTMANGGSIYYTTKQADGLLYALFTKWPSNNVLSLSCVVLAKHSKVYFLGLHDATRGTNRSILQYNTATNLDIVDIDDTTATTRIQRRRHTTTIIDAEDNDEGSEERKRHPTTSNGQGRRIDDGGIEVVLPALTPDIIPCQHAWVVVLTEIRQL